MSLLEQPPPDAPLTSTPFVAFNKIFSRSHGQSSGSALGCERPDAVAATGLRYDVCKGLGAVVRAHAVEGLLPTAECPRTRTRLRNGWNICVSRMADFEAWSRLAPRRSRKAAPSPKCRLLRHEQQASSAASKLPAQNRYLPEICHQWRPSAFWGKSSSPFENASLFPDEFSEPSMIVMRFRSRQANWIAGMIVNPMSFFKLARSVTRPSFDHPRQR